MFTLQIFSLKLHYFQLQLPKMQLTVCWRRTSFWSQNEVKNVTKQRTCIKASLCNYEALKRICISEKKGPESISHFYLIYQFCCTLVFIRWRKRCYILSYILTRRAKGKLLFSSCLVYMMGGGRGGMINIFCPGFYQQH